MKVHMVHCFWNSIVQRVTGLTLIHDKGCHVFKFKCSESKERPKHRACKRPLCEEIPKCVLKDTLF